MFLNCYSEFLGAERLFRSRNRRKKKQVKNHVYDVFYLAAYTKPFLVLRATDAGIWVIGTDHKPALKCLIDLGLVVTPSPLKYQDRLVVSGQWYKMVDDRPLYCTGPGSEPEPGYMWEGGILCGNCAGGLGQPLLLVPGLPEYCRKCGEEI